MKINDLPEVENLDPFLRALVPNVRIEVKLHGSTNFHEAAIYLECADIVLLRVCGQDSSRKWHNSNVNISENLHWSFQAGSTSQTPTNLLHVSPVVLPLSTCQLVLSRGMAHRHL